MKAWIQRSLAAAVACGAFLLLTGCEDSSSSSSKAQEEDIGSNNPDVLVALGDSVTAGTELNGPSYPEILSGLLGKTVVNEGRGGALSYDGAERINGVLSNYQPSYVLILYGINDIIHVGSYDWTINNLRTMVHAAKDNQTIPVLATIPPRHRGDGVFDPRHKELNRRIRNLASDEGAPLADVESEFGDNPDLLQEDGFHPNEDGNRIIAMTFYDVLR